MRKGRLVVKQPIRLLQITDSHLFEQARQQLIGLDTEHSFDAVVALAAQENANIPITAILATGDIAQDGSVRAYSYYRDQVSQFQAPILWLPGNHDDATKMRQSLRSTGDDVSPCARQFGNWVIIMLDSSVLTKVYGRINDYNLAFLHQSLAAFSDQHCMVCLHHHPLDCGSKWLDRHNLKNAPALWDVLHQHANVRALIWGHIHQDFVAQHTYRISSKEMSFPCYAPPSTCIQFKPNCDDFALDDVNPGYRWFDLHADGSLKTGVSRTEIDFRPDMKSQGY